MILKILPLLFALIFTAPKRHHDGCQILLRTDQIIFGTYHTYSVLQPLGHGGCGQVYLAYNKNGTSVIKVPLKNFDDIYRELEFNLVLLQWTGPFVYMEDYYDPRNKDSGLENFPWISFPYYGLGDLHKYIKQRRMLDLAEVRSVTKDIITGLLVLHSNNYVHYDLKPANLVIYQDGSLRVKMIDFGLVRPVKDVPETNKYGTYYYAAPEVLLYRKLFPINTISDMWSVGVIMHKMFTGRYLFPSTNDYVKDYKRHILGLKSTASAELRSKYPDKFKHKYKKEKSIAEVVGCDFADEITMWESCYMDFVDLACYCDLLLTLLEFDVNIRSNAKDALEHPFFGKRQR